MGHRTWAVQQLLRQLTLKVPAETRKEMAKEILDQAKTRAGRYLRDAEDVTTVLVAGVSDEQADQGEPSRDQDFSVPPVLDEMPKGELSPQDLVLARMRQLAEEKGIGSSVQKIAEGALADFCKMGFESPGFYPFPENLIQVLDTDRGRFSFLLVGTATTTFAGQIYESGFEFDGEVVRRTSDLLLKDKDGDSVFLMSKFGDGEERWIRAVRLEEGRPHLIRFWVNTKPKGDLKEGKLYMVVEQTGATKSWSVRRVDAASFRALEKALNPKKDSDPGF
jgi:hypothetical protein